MPKPFADFDFKNFWLDLEYASEELVSEPLTNEMLAYVEDELGYKLPLSYIRLMQSQNGGEPKKNCFRIDDIDHNFHSKIQIQSIFGIGETQTYSLLGELGSQFWIKEWEYPDIGVYFADTLASGHEMLAFDYTNVGTNDEPQIVLVNQEDNFNKYFVAENFETFIKNLK